MKRSASLSLIVLVALLALLWLAGIASAGRSPAPAAPQAGAPAVVSYQGQVIVSGTPYTGTAYFKFAIVDLAGTTSYWSNDGTSTDGGEPDKPVSLTVSGGLFSILLGDTALDNMLELPASAFTGTDRWLRVWFSSDNSTFVQLAPDRWIAAAPYALQAEEAKSAATAGDADLLDGQDASAFAASGHTHATLAAGTGLSGGSYDGGAAATFAVTYGTAAGTAVQGNQTASITAGTGLTGGVSGDALGDGFAATLNVGGGNGITANADNLALGPLTANWSQTGAFDVILGNAASELQILESAGATYYGTFDVGDLSANETYAFTTGGTVWTSGNDGSASTLDADLLDGLHASSFAGASHNHDAAYVNEGQADSITSAMIQNGAILFADINQNGCAANQVMKWNGTAWACAADDGGAGGSWSLIGNAGTVPGTNYVGTSDAVTLTLAVSGTAALRIGPSAASPNLIGGYDGNWQASGVSGAAIGGGGSSGNPNRVTDDFGTVGGGADNQAGDNAGTVTDTPYATVGGGNNNAASGSYATIGGGAANTASGYYATVSGGGNSTASGNYATIGGGTNNIANGYYATVGGGSSDTASGYQATVSGGYSNTASGHYATVPGGQSNTASGDYSFAAGERAKANHTGSFVWADATNADFASTGMNQFLLRATGGVMMAVGPGGLRILPDATSPNLVGGSISNTVSAGVRGATIAGGGLATSSCGAGYTEPCWNRVQSYYATVGGGYANSATGGNSTVGGGYGNTASGGDSTIAGGSRNAATGTDTTVGGGFNNTAYGHYSTIGGGTDNTCTTAGNPWYATIGGGRNNTGGGDYATIGGGAFNSASGLAATVPGGYDNTAAGSYSFAAGAGARAYHMGSFVWADSAWTDFVSTGNNQFMVRATGGITIYTNSDLTAGVRVAPGGSSWSWVSDRSLKENFADVDGQALLDALAGVPVTTWNYKSQDPSIRHIGPVAQDFYAAFGVGEDDTHISTIDPDGVALAASQALYRLAQDQARQIAGLQAENAQLKTYLGSLEHRLAALEAGLANDRTAPATRPWPQSAGLLLLGLSVPAGLVWAARRRRLP